MASGATCGALGGGLVAAPICGPGAPICAVAFVLGGSIIGGVLGSSAAEILYDEADEFIEWDIL